MHGRELSGADILVNALIDLGVDTVFGYPGGAVLPIYDAIKGAVITSGKASGFCAGADLSAGAKTFDYDNRTDRPDHGSGQGGLTYEMEEARDGGGRLTLRIFECLKPVIAAVNGPAVGIGSTMQLPMDIRFASTKARFGLVFARRGIVPEAASSWFLPRIVGLPQALEWCMTGRVFDAQEALRGGLVRSVHEPEDLLPAATALAREIADNTSSVSVAMTRAMLWHNPQYDHPMKAHRVDSRAIYTLSRGADAKEGVASFLEKRAPNYPARVSSDMPAFYPWWDEPGYE